MVQVTFLQSNNPTRPGNLCLHHTWPGWGLLQEQVMSKQIQTSPLPTMSQKDIDRFWSMVSKQGSGDCWEWTAGTYRRGYGAFHLNNRSFGAHRIAYYLAMGIDPQGLCVCHSCDNPPCCNPAHLWTGTHLDNNLDMKAKGRLEQGGRKLNESDVRTIRKLYKAGNVFERELGAMFGVTQKNISHIITRRNWPNVN